MAKFSICHTTLWWKYESHLCTWRANYSSACSDAPRPASRYNDQVIQLKGAQSTVYKGTHFWGLRRQCSRRVNSGSSTDQLSWEQRPQWVGNWAWSESVETPSASIHLEVDLNTGIYDRKLPRGLEALDNLQVARSTLTKWPGGLLTRIVSCDMVLQSTSRWTVQHKFWPGGGLMQVKWEVSAWVKVVKLGVN